MKKLLYGVFLRIRALVISIKQVNKVHLMDQVIYDGKECFVNNGASAPVWDLCEEAVNLHTGKRNTYKVHEKDFKKVRSLKNLKNDLFYHYNWYMTYWYSIDLRRLCDK